MKVFPETAAEDVGLEPVLERLRSHIVSLRVQKKVESLEYAVSETSCLERLILASELQDCLRFDDPIPFQAGEDIIPSLDRARPEGAALAAEEFIQIRMAARTARLCHSYFASRVDQYPRVTELFSPVALSKDVESAISGVFDADGNIRDNASPDLGRIRRELQNARSSLRKSIMRVLAGAISNGYATEEQPTVRGGRMVIPVRVEAKRKISGFIQDVSATGQTVYIEPAECLDQNNRIRELETEEIREIENIRRALTDVVRECSELLKAAASILDEFELEKGISELANELGAVVPAFNTDGRISIINGRSPELLLHFQNQARLSNDRNDLSRKVVPLNLELGNPDRSLVISGPNAGGKSVALKTLGVFQLMLGLGIPIPVDETSSFSYFNSVFIDIGDSQSVEDDLSTYSSHLARLKVVLENADSKSLVLVDEAGTGTDPEEGSALFQAVLEALLRSRAFTVITTHHGALKYFADETQGIQNGSMVFDQSTLTPTFVFQQGEPGSSYATEMAERVGFPSTVLDRARALLGSEKADVSSLLTRLASRIADVERASDEVAVARAEADKVRLQFEERLSRIREENSRIKDAALLEARQIVQNANRTIERAVRRIKESDAAKEPTKKARESVERLRSDLERSEDRQRRKHEARSSRGTAAQSGRKIKKPKQRDAGSKKTRLSSKDSGRNDLSIGDRVVIDGGTVVGELAEFKNKKALVLFGSAQTRVDVGRLSRVSGPEKQRVTVQQTRRSGEAPSIMNVKSRLDARGMRVSEALAEVTILIDQALVSGLKMVEILHGKGTGALRQAIHEYVVTRPDVAKVEEAHPDQGGSGVSFVWLAE